MISDEVKKERILDYAFRCFIHSGYTQVTMDEIARGVGMGKGTVYKFFSSKEELLLSTVDYFADQMFEKIDGIITDDSLKSADKLNLFLKTVAEKLSQFKPELIYYLERNMPKVYHKIEEIRTKMVLTNLVRILEDGKSNGLYDPQMDVYLVAHIVIGAIKHCTDGAVWTTLDYSFDRLFTSIISVILRGCLTKEARIHSLTKELP